MANNWEEHWLEMPEYNNVKQPDPLITANSNLLHKRIMIYLMNY